MLPPRKLGWGRIAPSEVHSAVEPSQVPQRTCVGCRDRAAKFDLLRVVAVDGELVVDRRGRLPGRGAYVHPDAGCLELAVRRQAFRRALRSTEQYDVRALSAHCPTR